MKTSFNLNATAGVTGGSDRHFLLHVVIGQILPFNGTPHSTRPSYFINDGLVTRLARIMQMTHPQEFAERLWLGDQALCRCPDIDALHVPVRDPSNGI